MEFDQSLVEIRKDFKEKAQFYFGMTFAGLNCKPCEFKEFNHWYLETHYMPATYEIYLIAQWIWHYYEPNF